MANKANHIIVHGMVQGVGFRYFVKRTATRMGLTGDVRNLPDSTVEIVVEGDPDQIEEFIKIVRQGPSMARVHRLEVHETAVKGDYQSFLIEGW